MAPRPAAAAASGSGGSSPRAAGALTPWLLTRNLPPTSPGAPRGARAAREQQATVCLQQL